MIAIRNKVVTSHPVTQCASECSTMFLDDALGDNHLSSVEIVDLSNLFATFEKDINRVNIKISKDDRFRVFQVIIELYLISISDEEAGVLTTNMTHSELYGTTNSESMEGLTINTTVITKLIDLAIKLNLRSLVPDTTLYSIACIPLRWVYSDAKIHIHTGIIYEQI